ncbi:plant UBX domain-containing protein 16-like [Elaeis guineensis]|uniref:plant UBX domain-containing protein 16-like n=1 Tax=Elaeis guineensis var. tenera TaxID=51953 RepID=UPI003C6DB344
MYPASGGISIRKMRPDPMENFSSSSKKKTLISSFLESATGMSSGAAINYLQVTNWRLEDAVDIFFPEAKLGTTCTDDGAGRDGVHHPIPVKREMIQKNFVFWQVKHGTDEGKKVHSSYKLVSLSAILVINPITEEKMKSWNGMRTAEKLFKDLLPFVDGGPKEHHDVPSCKQQRIQAFMFKPASISDKISTNKEAKACSNADLEHLHLPK